MHRNEFFTVFFGTHYLENRFRGKSGIITLNCGRNKVKVSTETIWIFDSGSLNYIVWNQNVWPKSKIVVESLML